MESIEDRARRILSEIEDLKRRCGLSYPVRLVAASKYASVEEIIAARRAGIRIFGENRYQDGVAKVKSLVNEDIEWHFIGRIQSNKVARIFDVFSLIQSVDRLEILQKAENHLADKGYVRDALLQVNISGEPQKAGFDIQTVERLFDEGVFKSFAHVRIKGLMAMGPTPGGDGDLKQIYQNFFRQWWNLRKRWSEIEILSVGMSQDYVQAIEAGSNMVRIGSHIFKGRDGKG